MSEDSLLNQIKSAVESKDYDAVKSLTQELIDYQKTLPTFELTDEELALKGVDMVLLQEERRLQSEIKELNQNGDFIEANKKMRELIQLQKLQPDLSSGVRMA